MIFTLKICRLSRGEKGINTEAASVSQILYLIVFSRRRVSFRKLAPVLVNRILLPGAIEIFPLYCYTPKMSPRYLEKYTVLKEYSAISPRIAFYFRFPKRTIFVDTRINTSILRRATGRIRLKK